ncbi:MFS transporter [Nocardia sp. NPDC050435]|uniref:MFS transporter n=1 Tax=Nocardia sp. NPDC050435 TaxID=3155040 RepID=UPI00340EC24C
MLKLLRRGPILAVWIAQLLSILGDRFFALAIMWLALERSGPIAMGLVAIAESVPFVIVGMVGHRLLTRVASLPVLAVIDGGRAVLVLAIPWAWATGGTPGMLVVVAALGVLGAVFDPSLGSLVPELVDDLERPALVALMDLTGRIARIAGPAAAAVVLLVAPMTALFAADAATFVISGLALAWVARARVLAHNHSAAVPGAGVAAPTRARQLLRAHPELLAAFAVQGAGYFLTALPAIGLPLLLAHHLGVGPAVYGWVMTASGVAALLGNLTASRLRAGSGFTGRFCAGWGASGLLMVGTGAVSNLGLVVVCAVAAGFVTPFIGIAMATRLTGFAGPQRLRLFSVNHMVMRGAGTAGMATVPALIADNPARGFVLGGSALAAVALLGWVLAPAAGGRKIRHAHVVETAPAASTTRS